MAPWGGISYIGVFTKCGQLLLGKAVRGENQGGELYGSELSRPPSSGVTTVESDGVGQKSRDINYPIEFLVVAESWGKKDRKRE